MDYQSSLTFISFEELVEPLAKNVEGSKNISFDSSVINQSKEEEERMDWRINKMLKSCFLDLSSIHPIPSLKSTEIRFCNTIFSLEEGYKSYIFGKEMRGGIYRIAFLSDGNKNTMFGLVKNSNDYSKKNIHLLSYLEGVCFMNGMFHNYKESDCKSFGELNKKDIISIKEELEYGDVISMEVNLISKNPKERTLDFFINRRHMKMFCSHLPESVKFGVCILCFVFILEYLHFIKISLTGKKSYVTFLSFVELNIPTFHRSKKDIEFYFDKFQKSNNNFKLNVQLSKGIRYIKEDDFIRISKSGLFKTLIIGNEMKKVKNLIYILLFHIFCLRDIL